MLCDVRRDERRSLHRGIAAGDGDGGVVSTDRDGTDVADDDSDAT